MGTSHLLWELERLKEVKGYEGMYNTWKMMVEDGTHFLAQRSVSIDGFYQAPNDDVHSSRMQGIISYQLNNIIWTILYGPYINYI